MRLAASLLRMTSSCVRTPPFVMTSSLTSTSSTSLFVYGTLMAPQVMQTLVGRLPRSCPARLLSPSSDDDNSNNYYCYYYSRHPVKSQVFPALIQRRTSTNQEASFSAPPPPPPPPPIINGILYQDLTPNEWKILDWFEDQEYKRINVMVEILLPVSSTKNTPPLLINTDNNNNNNNNSASACSSSSSSSSADTTTNSMVVAPAQTYLWINPHSELDKLNDEAAVEVDWDYERFSLEHLESFLEDTVRPCRKELERLGYDCSSTTSSGSS